MSVVIRLSKLGRKGEAKYRIVVAEKRSRRNGKPIDTLGYYEKKLNDSVKKIDKKRLEHWISQGAKPTATVYDIIK